MAVVITIFILCEILLAVSRPCFVYLFAFLAVKSHLNHGVEASLCFPFCFSLVPLVLSSQVFMLIIGYVVLCAGTQTIILF